MARLTILGSANSIPDATHDNTHMVVDSGDHIIMVDCVSNPIVRLEQAGIDPLSVSALILTHFHPDHVYGVPLFLMDSWLLGRTTPLQIYGLPETVSRMEALMDLFGWRKWPNFFEVIFCPFLEVQGDTLVEFEELRISATSVCHMIPTMGLRFDFRKLEKSAAYSCDTEPCSNMIHLASLVDVLIHEAAGGTLGHSSPGQAGDVARMAGAKALYLIHYPTRNPEPEKWLSEAREHFPGPVNLAEDFMKIDF